MQTLSALADAINPARRSSDRISEELQSIDAALAASRSAYGALCLDEVDGVEGASKAKQKAEAERDKLLKRRDDLTSALAVAQIREQKAAAEEAATEARKAWQAVAGLADARLAAAQRMNLAAIEFAEAYAALLGATEAVYNAIPAQAKSHVDIDAAKLRAQAVEEAVRLTLLQKGVEWSINYPWKQNIPEFVPQFDGATNVIKAWEQRA